MSRNIYLHFRVSDYTYRPVCPEGKTDAPRRTRDFTVTHLKDSLFLSFLPHRTSAAAFVSLVTTLRKGRPENCGSIATRGQEISAFTTEPRPSLGLIQPSIQWQTSRDVALTPYLRQLPRLRICGATYPPLHTS
jgi:hypothetical protein